MKWTSIVAVYLLIWVMSGFLVLPFGVKNANELGVPMVPGQAEGAPANFSPLRVIIRTTVLASILFAIFALNARYGWVTMETLTFFHPPAAAQP